MSIEVTTAPPPAAASAREGRAHDVARTLDLSGRGRWRRRLVTLLILGGLGVAAYFIIQSASEPPPPTQYRTAAAEIGDIVTRVSATGTVEPVRVVDIGPEISGRVVEVGADVNERVTAGQILVRLDTEPLEARLEQSQAQLEAAVASVRQARATLTETRQAETRAQTLGTQGVSARAQLETAIANRARAQAALAGAQAQQRIAEAGMRQVETDLARATIRSPIDGVVLSRIVEPGMAVAASLQTPVLFRIAEDLAQMELRLAIDEADVGQVSPGMEATFTVDAFPQRRFPAEVRLVHFAPQAEQAVVTYRAVLVVDNAELLLRPGMTATATITSSTVAGVLRVPNTALRFTPPDDSASAGGGGGPGFFPGAPQRIPGARGAMGGNRGGGPPGAARGGGGRVYVLEDGEPKLVRVVTGATDGAFTEVRGRELAEGVEVIIGIDAGAP